MDLEQCSDLITGLHPLISAHIKSSQVELYIQVLPARGQRDRGSDPASSHLCSPMLLCSFTCLFIHIKLGSSENNWSVDEAEYLSKISLLKLMHMKVLN